MGMHFTRPPKNIEKQMLGKFIDQSKPQNFEQEISNVEVF